MRNRFAFVFAVLLCGTLVLAKDVEEKFDDGTVHLRYRIDAKDQKNGDYLELYPGGKTHVKGFYTGDKKNGVWTTFDEAGKPQEIATYRNDQLDGPYQWNYPAGNAQMRGNYRNGALTAVTTFDRSGNQIFSLAYPIPLDTVKKAWKTWYPANRSSPKMLEEPSAQKPYKAGRMADESQQAALKYLELYRFLSGVTVANMGIDADYAVMAQHGAVIERKLGHLTHTPDKPDDMDAAFYKTAYAGTSSSNIEQGSRDLFGAVDDYMYDSDDSNVARVGHRQWILTPSVQKVAFGYCDGFSTLYVFDGTKRIDLNWLYIAYPGPGYYPHRLIRDDAAWSLSLNTEKCKVGGAESMEIKISTLDEHFAVTDTSTGKIENIAPCPDSGAWQCVIFRPNLAHLGVGRFVVQVNGIKTPTGAPAPLSYLVDVIDMAKDAQK